MRLSFPIVHFFAIFSLLRESSPLLSRGFSQFDAVRGAICSVRGAIRSISRAEHAQLGKKEPPFTQGRATLRVRKEAQPRGKTEQNVRFQQGADLCKTHHFSFLTGLLAT